MYKKIIFSGAVLCAIVFLSFKNNNEFFQKNHADISNYKNKTIEADSNKLFCPDDMEISLWAQSPMLYNPTNMDVDHKGRVWITEAVNYRDFNNKPDSRLNHINGERIVILEDTNADGKADKSTVFVEDKDMISPLGIAVLGNKVYVSAAPNLIIYTDTNGDDKADKKEIFLTGFGGKDHDHSLHSGVAGPDNNFYFNVGNAGPHMVTDQAGFNLRSGSIYTGGTPYNLENTGNRVSDDGKVWVGGLALRIGKDGKGLKVLAHNFRNSYEVAIDSYGNMWQNDNDDQVIVCRTSFVMEGGNYGYFSADGTRSWQADRRPGLDMFTSSWHGDDPDAMPVGDNTGAGSPTGVHVYEGDAFGSKYQGMLLSCEAGRNVIFNYFPKTNGAGFELNRNDLVSSQGKNSSEIYEWYQTVNDNRKWFRPSDICSGTDGSIFIADWYDPVVGGHAMKDKIANGRIYRMVPKGKKLITPKIDLSTTEGQIEALKNPAQNVRNLGFEALKTANSIAAVKELLNAENPFHKARAVWLLAQMGPEGLKTVEELLQSSNDKLRLVAFRALRQQTNDVTELCKKVINDKSSAVLREVAIALSYEPFEKSKSLIKNLINHYDGKDAVYLAALGVLAGNNTEQVYAIAKESFSNQAANWTVQQENLIWRLHPVSAVKEISARILTPDLTDASLKKMLTALGFIKHKTAVDAMLELSKSGNKQIKEGALWWINYRKTNDWAELANWKTVAQNTISVNYKKMMVLRSKILNEKLPVSDRIIIAKQMAKDIDGGNILIDIKTNYVDINEKVNEAISEEIFNNPDLKVRTMASQLFTRNGEALKIDFVARMKGDMVKGNSIFKTNCATCHLHGEDGADIGPNLTNIHKKFDKIGLLDAIVNPSASMVFGYESYSIVTKKGNSYFGFITAETSTNITIKDVAGNQNTIKKDMLKSKTKMASSLMPNPTSMGLKEQELADLSSFLLSFN
jgi:putative membrane-bound dehydrogenase-like protein